MSIFIDEALVWMKGGDGGNGCMSFRREKFVPFGGPDGGDGGRGGNVVVEASPALSTLLDFRYKRHFKADRGRHGRGKNMSGKEGEDLLLPVPVGTVVYDRSTGEILADLFRPGQQIVAARGGCGGKGNTHFANAANKAPKFAEKGEPGEVRDLRFELKLLADVGIIGFPNAGKSTLLSRISAARPKIADYPFTTLTPQLGVVARHDRQGVFADIPGLIEGAHEGAGLGIKFLKHIERTRLLVHLIDLNEVDPENPFRLVEAIDHELSSFSPQLRGLPQIYVGNKLDLPEVREKSARLTQAFQDQEKPFFLISAFTGEGVPEVLDAVFEALERFPKADFPHEEISSPKPEVRIEVCREGDHFRVIGKGVERAAAMTNLDNEEAVDHLQRILSRYRVEPRLRQLGVQEGDLVKIGQIEFHYKMSVMPSRKRRGISE